MPQLRCDFKEGNEHKRPLGKARMRQRQGRGPQDRVSMEQHVYIEGPRPLVPLFGTIPPEFRLYGLRALQEFQGIKFGVPRCHDVEKIGLVEYIPGRRPVDR